MKCGRPRVTTVSGCVSPFGLQGLYAGSMHLRGLNWFWLFRRPFHLVWEGIDWLLAKSPRLELEEQRSKAKQLSDVLQIPIIDAELSLELSNAFFHPTRDPALNSEAIELLCTPPPHNETWRARAGACCLRLRALNLSPEIGAT